MTDLIQKIEIAKAAANDRGMRAFDKLQDDQRYDFLDRLHVAAQDQPSRDGNGAEIIFPAKIKLSNWEKHFVASLVTEHRPLSHAQRQCIDELRHRFETFLTRQK